VPRQLDSRMTVPPGIVRAAPPPARHPKFLSNRCAERLFRIHPLACEASSDPADLTARPGPKARPEAHAANFSPVSAIAMSKNKGAQC
jgi:hypothetical protein